MEGKVGGNGACGAVSSMDCFSCIGALPAAHGEVIITSRDGYEMRASKYARIEILNARGETEYKPIAELRDGDLLVLNVVREGARARAVERARAWLLGALLPLVRRDETSPDDPIVDREIATPRDSLAQTFVEKVSRIFPNACAISITTSQDGVFHLQSDIFAAVLAESGADNAMSRVACARIGARCASRSNIAALISGLCAVSGSRNSLGHIVLPAISEAFAMFIMNALIKFGVHAKRNGVELTITSHESIAALRALFRKCVEHNVRDREALAKTVLHIVIPGVGTRAPSPGEPAPSPRRASATELLFGSSSNVGASSAPAAAAIAPSASSPIILPEPIEPRVMKYVLTTQFARVEDCA